MRFVLFFIAMAIFSSLMAKEDKSYLGKQTYEIACQNCHSPKVAKGMGAPAAFNAKAWEKVLVAAQHKAALSHKFATGYDYLIYQVKIGKGMMQHGGLCHESRNEHPSLMCNDEAFLAAIHYMSSAKAK